MVQILGTYKGERCENLDPLYLRLGMSYEERYIVGSRCPTTQVSKNEEEQWNFKTVYVFGSKTVENSFKLDEEYEDSLPNGKPLKSITTMDGDHKFVTKSKGVEDPNFTIETHFEFTETGMIMTMTLPASSGPLVAKRFFKRIATTLTS